MGRLTQRDGLGPAAPHIFDRLLLATARRHAHSWYPVIPQCVPWCPDRNQSAAGRSRPRREAPDEDSTRTDGPVARTGAAVRRLGVGAGRIWTCCGVMPRG